MAGEEVTKVPEDKKPEPIRDVLPTFDFLKALKKKPDQTAIFYGAPEEFGVDIDEAGLKVGQRVGIKIGPIKVNDDGEIREQIKDFPEAEWPIQYANETILRGIIEPKIPDNAEGRAMLDRWLPGTRIQMGSAIRAQSGMGPLRDVKSARDELGKLSALTGTMKSN